MKLVTFSDQSQAFSFLDFEAREFRVQPPLCLYNSNDGHLFKFLSKKGLKSQLVCEIDNRGTISLQKAKTAPKLTFEFIKTFCINISTNVRSDLYLCKIKKK